ncbi:MAG: hypothetical protein EU535_01735 [Promethearchaeota archaeon]|nr:MAG: hypothetical protein EU535_01735 [Candidatus Lokiarchaeota archaeon]
MLEKMENLGPFEGKESKWLLFSIANPYERHGPALPLMTDDFHAKRAAYELELRTGQKYVAHIPYTTDRCGPVAKEWAPYYMPWEEFYDKTVNFMKYHINLLRNRGEEISYAMLLVSHGGNADIMERKYQREIQKELDLKKFLSLTAHVSRKNAVRVLEEVKKLSIDVIEKEGQRYGCSTPEELSELYTRILLSTGHASHTEHSLIAAMGLCDMQKVDMVNSLLEKNFEATLKRWPALGGLGGYLLAGGKYTEALGTEDNDKYGLWNCLNGLKTFNNGKLIVDAELGALVQRISLETKIELIDKYL